MKVLLKHLAILALLAMALNTSCRKEEFISEGQEPQDNLAATSNAANLMFRTTLKDGSADNILDRANCFTLELPLTVLVNNEEIRIATETDYQKIEILLDESDLEQNTVQLVFPVTATNANYEQTVIANQTELSQLAAQCPGENQEDEDIECVDFNYPLVISIFNTTTEFFDKITFTSDESLNEFIVGLNEDDKVGIEFPLVVTLASGTEIEVDDLQSLENTIEGVVNQCDEDDDFDYDDDNCNDCTLEQLTQILFDCDSFRVKKFILNGENVRDDYDGLSFFPLEDGTLSFASEDETLLGSWSASGSGNHIEMTFDIPTLTDLSLNWKVTRIIDSSGVRKVTLKNEGGDILIIQDECSLKDTAGNTPVFANEVLVGGTWLIDTYTTDNSDETANFDGFTLNFTDDGQVVADNAGNLITGQWAFSNGNTRLEFDFGDVAPFSLLNINWKIGLVSTTEINLHEPVQGNNTAPDQLIIKKL